MAIIIFAISFHYKGKSLSALDIKLMRLNRVNVIEHLLPLAKSGNIVDDMLS